MPNNRKKLEDMISEEELNKIISMYQNNISLREIEKQTFHGRNAIAKMLERLQVKTSYGNHYRKYFFDFDFFEVIDTELKAYWLGFMYADGNIESSNIYGEQSFKLSLAEQDLEILEKFKNDLNSTYPIRKDESKHLKNPNCQVMYIHAPRSQKTVNDLIRQGCLEHKSLILKFPTEQQVPKELLPHFIRGYFDGDGSISAWKSNVTINFVGTKDFITGLANALNFIHCSVYPDKRKENSWYCSISGKNSAKLFYSYCYSNATRYMLRKYNKFNSIIN